MTELRADDLKCCGNCEHFEMKYELGFCNAHEDRDLENYHVNDESIISTLTHNAPACEKWELHTVIWERIYNNLPKNAEPITVSEEEYERLFGGK